MSEIKVNNDGNYRIVKKNKNNEIVSLSALTSYSIAMDVVMHASKVNKEYKFSIFKQNEVKK